MMGSSSTSSRNLWLQGSIAALVLMLMPFATAHAVVSRVEIIERVTFADGMSFGDVGPYEKIRGRLHYEVDPANPANGLVFDLQYAPRNANGKVEIVGDFILLKPVDLARGNHRLLYEVNNRGNLGMLGYYNNGTSSNNPSTGAHAGNGFLMRQGYSLLWSAWNWDVVPGNGRLQVEVPIATDNGQSITGLINAETVTATLTGPDQCQPIAWGNSRGYEPVDAADRSEAVLTVRDDPWGPKTAIAGDQWAFKFTTTGGATVTNFCVNDGVGIQSGRIYELIYRAKDPRIVGLGLAAIRDAISFFHFEAQDSIGTPNPLAVAGQPDPKYAYLFGISQSGRVIVHFLWQGFHVDETGRMVAEGLIPHVAGGGKGGFNWRFAQTTHHPSHLEGLYFPVDFFPFTYQPVTDPVTGQRGSLLDTARALGKVPRIIVTNHESEYGARAASLVHTDPTGTTDVQFPETVRFYMVNGAQHGAPATRTRALYEYSGTTLDQRPVGRALLVALDNWVSRGIEPPDSKHPRIQKGQLVSPAQHYQMMPAIPGMWNVPGMWAAQTGGVEQAARLDYGPRFFTEGIQDVVPPTRLGNYVNLVPVPDKDGTTLGGIRLPDVRVPLGTYTGWNPRKAAIGNPHYLARWDGSFFMFPLTEADRQATGDPRPSIASRYKNQEVYVERIAGAAHELQAEGFLLQEDVQDMISRAQKMVWPPMPVETYPFWKMLP